MRAPRADTSVRPYGDVIVADRNLRDVEDAVPCGVVIGAHCNWRRGEVTLPYGEAAE